MNEVFVKKWSKMGGFSTDADEKHRCEIDKELEDGNNNDICLLFDITDDFSPLEKHNKVFTDSVVGYGWLSRMMAEDVAVRYEFESSNDRAKFEDGLPDWAKRCLCRNVYIIQQMRVLGFYSVTPTLTGYSIRENSN